ncbi:hypothetical protein BDN70DRAFT_884196 [Pholiota conissans]|uniref:Uncharacterized protein n=1 Tax=Pholiota conissans TaxID=109636 RepID=A0A9P6CQG0_9AGAR|nr:hypothetical protein BDN70DRAFT_884196 [Pholiota conissans]
MNEEHTAKGKNVAIFQSVPKIFIHQNKQKPANGAFWTYRLTAARLIHARGREEGIEEIKVSPNTCIRRTVLAHILMIRGIEGASFTSGSVY